MLLVLTLTLISIGHSRKFIARLPNLTWTYWAGELRLSSIRKLSIFPLKHSRLLFAWTSLNIITHHVSIGLVKFFSLLILRVIIHIDSIIVLLVDGLIHHVILFLLLFVYWSSVGISVVITFELGVVERSIWEDAAAKTLLLVIILAWVWISILIHGHDAAWNFAANSILGKSGYSTDVALWWASFRNLASLRRAHVVFGSPNFHGLRHEVLRPGPRRY